MDAELEALTDALMGATLDAEWWREEPAGVSAPLGDFLRQVREWQRLGDTSLQRSATRRRVRAMLQRMGNEHPEETGRLRRILEDRRTAELRRAREVVARWPAEREPSPAVGVTSTRNAVSGGTFHEPVIQAGTVTGGMHTYYGQPPHSGLPPVTDWPQLDLADPIDLGVRRPRRIADEPPLPRYVVRDCDPGLEAQVRTAARNGGLVLVTGEPLSGRTRTLWSALFTNLSGTTRVLTPVPGTDLRQLPAVLRARGGAECVLWLDDLDGHLGEHGLTAALLAELVRLRVPVLATMSDEAYDAHRFGSPAHARLLSGVEPVELSTEWSPAEQERLAAAARDDLRLAGAYTHRTRHSTPAYLTVGPELLGEWRRARRANAHPLGHRLVLAAIDLARCGVEAAVPVDVLRAASDLYENAVPGAPHEDFDQALAWASGIRHGVTGMLVPGAEGGTWRVYGSLIEDARDGLPGFGPVPLELWPRAFEAVAREDAASPAVDVVLESARAVLGPQADRDPEALLTLGRIEEEYGDDAAAGVWFRRAAEAGSTEAAGRLGSLLFDREDLAAATPYLEEAAESGNVEAQRLLGIALAQRSEHWLRAAAESGDAVSAFWLGDLLRGDGDHQLALHWYQRAAEWGRVKDVASRIGSLYYSWGDYEESVRWHRIAVREGDSQAVNDLGLALEQRGETEEAALLFQQSAEQGDATGASNFGLLLDERGEPEEARKWFAKAHELGDYAAAYLLGRSLTAEKRYGEAEEWFRKAKEVGHHYAERELADLKAARGGGPRLDGSTGGTPDTVKE
ncbi:tetratricopeptide repeat protein [Streptomyces sp. C11-1]|uniref:Tetratricopeptide repeat protein n=1 Tax=Streptomyces durocortorensis TaxID=2811104 RepID=A0ABY9VU70_9ACTN|nr:tetratricopeptide repeat protein [Streptomyces durocortorensis]WNF27469.1 tetratricopeptide repeat protein [Streptomyces durocortorensis]